jgi:hypothetical protein
MSVWKRERRQAFALRCSWRDSPGLRGKNNSNIRVAPPGLDIESALHREAKHAIHMFAFLGIPITVTVNATGFNASLALAV